MVAYNTLVQGINLGGLKLADLESRIKAQHIKFMNRILDDDIPISKAFLELHSKSPVEYIFLTRKMSIPPLQKFSPYNNSVLSSWTSVRQNKPMSIYEVYNEILWDNDLITCNGSPITNNVWRDAGILFVKDIVRRGHFMSQEEIINRYHVPCTFLDARNIRFYIPQTWRDQIRRDNGANRNVDSDHLYNLLDGGNDTYIVSELSSKFIYDVCISRIPFKCIGFLRWSKYCEDQNFAPPTWSELSTRPFRIARETKFHSFYYRLLQDFITTNAFLKMIGKPITDQCDFCEARDNTPHFLLTCVKIRPFRESVYRWIHTVTGVDVSLWNSFEQLFGKSPGRDPNLAVICVLLMLVNAYIYRQILFHSANCDFMQWLLELKSRLCCEKHICFLEKKKSKFNKWANVYDNL